MSIQVIVRTLAGESLLDSSLANETQVEELCTLVASKLGTPQPSRGTTYFADHADDPVAQLHSVSGGVRRHALKFLFESTIVRSSQRVMDISDMSPLELTVLHTHSFLANASDIHGPHTDNPTYYKRHSSGDPDEFLELIYVCWIQIGATFTDIPAGSYQVRMELKRVDGFNVNEVKLQPGNKLWRTVDLTPDFHVFEIDIIVIDEFQPELRVELHFFDGTWKQGLCIRSIELAPI